MTLQSVHRSKLEDEGGKQREGENHLKRWGLDRGTHHEPFKHRIPVLSLCPSKLCSQDCQCLQGLRKPGVFCVI